MAIAYIDAVLRGVRGILPAEKLILVILADYARAPGGTSWPSVATIAWEAGIERRQVTAHLARLRAAGWLEVVGGNRGGRGKSTHYRLNLERIVDDAECAKHARARMVKSRSNNAAARMLSASETMQSGVLNHAVQRTKPCTPASETMHSTAYEPLNLAVITSTGISRTSKPIDKDLNPKPENPTSNPLAELTANLTARQPEETETERISRIEANRQRQLEAVRAAKG